MEEKAHKRAIWAWTMYDWGNSAFATTIMAAVLPVYYSSVAASNLQPNIATAYWGYTTSLAALSRCHHFAGPGSHGGFSRQQEELSDHFHGRWCHCDRIDVLHRNR